MEESLKRLLKNSYSPYSGFRVASICLMKDGKSFGGVNDIEDINSHKELNKIATYDDAFDKLVREKLLPVADKCYVFLVKNPANYHFEQIWTNKGLEKAIEIAKLRFRFKHTYYNSKDYDKMENLILKHNRKVKKDTEKAVEVLKANGFKVVSDRFAALS